MILAFKDLSKMGSTLVQELVLFEDNNRGECPMEYLYLARVSHEDGRLLMISSL
jgi:hypothetical protein